MFNESSENGPKCFRLITGILNFQLLSRCNSYDMDFDFGAAISKEADDELLYSRYYFMIPNLKALWGSR